MDTASRTASHPHPAGNGNPRAAAPPAEIGDVYPTALNTTGVATPRPQPAAPAPATPAAAAAPATAAAHAPTAHAAVSHAAAPAKAHPAPAAYPTHAPANPAARAATASPVAKPHQPAVAAATATAAPPAGAPAGPAAPGKPSNRRRLVIAGVGAAVVAGLVVGLLVWHPWQSGPPRLNAPSANIAAYTSSPEFTKLPFDRQVAYLKQMNDKEDELAQSFLDGKMNDREYAKAKQAAHLGAEFTHMKKYYERPPGKEREAYLDKLLEKKEEDKSDEPKQPKKKADGTVKPVKTHAKDDPRAQDVKRDDSDESTVLKTWPATVQQEYQEFRGAVRNRKKSLKDQEAKELREFKEQKAAEQRAKAAGQK